MNNWQPIETAPKDGEPILLFCPKYKMVGERVVKAWWEDDDWTEGYRSVGYFSHTTNSRQGDPTHWQALPSPPTEPTPAKGEFGCLICTKPVHDYIPQYCCSGYECGCMGQPIDPCVCSSECNDAVFNNIGMPMEQRRIKASIDIWIEPNEKKETLNLKDHSWSDTSLYSDLTGHQICTHSIYGDATEDNQDELERVQAKNMKRLRDCWNLLAGHDVTKVSVVDKSVIEGVKNVLADFYVILNSGINIYNDYDKATALLGATRQCIAKLNAGGPTE